MSSIVSVRNSQGMEERSVVKPLKSVSRPWLLRNIKVDFTIKREAINGPVDNLKEKTKVRKSPTNLEGHLFLL